ncbi:hypothetical protein J8F10_06485 [Gemmata sp. G18]|uniref:Uncharacterized protein n=1 Tax=Gemmata palustris TaxID=2822762 RepID=A0ABS5BN84_9BACT|nr:hypothetical protein [Gemmata palustris]MBP3954927.1 hypothetical protein [Gemmata palustris]
MVKEDIDLLLNLIKSYEDLACEIYSTEEEDADCDWQAAESEIQDARAILARERNKEEIACH